MTIEVELEMTPQGLILRTKFRSGTEKESIQALLRVYSEYLRQYRLGQEKECLDEMRKNGSLRKLRH